MSHDAVNLVLSLLPEIALLVGGSLIVMLFTSRRESADGSSRSGRAAGWAALFTVLVAAVLLQLNRGQGSQVSGLGSRESAVREQPPGPERGESRLAATRSSTTCRGTQGIACRLSDEATAPPAIFIDRTSRAVRWAAIFMGVFLIAGSFSLPDRTAGTRLRVTGRAAPEFFMLLLFSLTGLMLVASANDLIVLFLALELTSLPTIVAVALSRPRHGAIESAGKYFFLAVLSAAFLLLGLAYVFGATGQTSLAGLVVAAAGAGRSAVGLTAIGLVVVGLAFNIASFPYHVYIADVYQGAAAPVSGWLAFVTKAAGFVALAKILSAVAGAASPLDPGWLSAPALRHGVAILAVATMLAGNALALWQRSVKRMLAYSSVAHSGYLLVGLLIPATADEPLPPVVAFYLVGYGLANLGAFLVVSRAGRGTGGRPGEADSFDDLRGLARRNLPAAVAIAIFGFSLMGLPPTVGFLGKVYIFVGAYRGGLGWLVVVALINSAIGAAYYLRMIAACWLDVLEDDTSASRAVPGPGTDGDNTPDAPAMVIVALSILTIAFGLFPAGLFRPMMH